MNIVPTSYSMQSGNFNGDGKTDLLFHNTQTGDLIVWDSGQSSAGHLIGSASGWTILGG